MAEEVVTPSTSTPPAGEAAPVAVVPAAGSATPAQDAAKADVKPVGDSLDRALRAAIEKKEQSDAKAKADGGETAKAAETKETPKADAKPKEGEADGEKPAEGADDAAKAVEAAKAPKTNAKDSQAPASWSAAAKAKFSTLDPILKNEVVKRERDIVAGVTKLQDELRAIKPEYEDLSRAIGPHKAMFNRRGITPGQAFTQLMALVDHADSDFLGFVKEQAALRGVDLLQALQTTQADPAKVVDPEIAALKQKLAGFETHLQSQNAAKAKSEAEAKDAAQRQIATQVETFQNEADSGGNLKHPHFDLVRAHMGGLMQADQTLSMEGAYEQACWAHPEIRETLTATISAKQEAQRKAEAEKAANASKSSVRGAPPSGNAGTKAAVDPKDLDATLRFMTQKHMGEGVRL